MQNSDKDRFFSIELKSRAFLRNVAVTNGRYETALIEGTIGRLESAQFTEGVVLEIVGEKGVLRINLTLDEIKQNKNYPEKIVGGGA